MDLEISSENAAVLWRRFLFDVAAETFLAGGRDDPDATIRRALIRRRAVLRKRLTFDQCPSAPGDWNRLAQVLAEHAVNASVAHQGENARSHQPLAEDSEA